jgi:hypothetical protein
MPGPGPGIHAFASLRREGVDGRPKAGHDGSEVEGRDSCEVQRHHGGYVDGYDRTVEEVAP